MTTTAEVRRAYESLAGAADVEKTARSLRNNGMTVLVAEDRDDARAKLRELIPEKAEVMDMRSMTLSAMGIPEAINDSGRYESVRAFLKHRVPGDREKYRRGAAPEWAIGSVHALTEDGQLLIASATGSQLPAYAYAAGRVVWVVSTKKIVRTLEDAFNRVIEHVYPREDRRAREATGRHSDISKMLIVNKETVPGRITVILVKENLGF